MGKAVKKTFQKTANGTTGTTTTTSPGNFAPRPTTFTQPKRRVTPTEEQVRARAFQIYLARNGAPGDAHSDWVQAERELTKELSK